MNLCAFWMIHKPRTSNNQFRHIQLICGYTYKFPPITICVQFFERIFRHTTIKMSRHCRKELPNPLVTIPEAKARILIQEVPHICNFDPVSLNFVSCRDFNLFYP